MMFFLFNIFPGTPNEAREMAFYLRTPFTVQRMCSYKCQSLRRHFLMATSVYRDFRRPFVYRRNDESLLKLKKNEHWTIGGPEAVNVWRLRGDISSDRVYRLKSLRYGIRAEWREVATRRLAEDKNRPVRAGNAERAQLFTILFLGVIKDQLYCARDARVKRKHFFVSPFPLEYS